MKNNQWHKLAKVWGLLDEVNRACERGLIYLYNRPNYCYVAVAALKEVLEKRGLECKLQPVKTHVCNPVMTAMTRQEIDITKLSNEEIEKNLAHKVRIETHVVLIVDLGSMGQIMLDPTISQANRAPYGIYLQPLVGLWPTDTNTRKFELNGCVIYYQANDELDLDIEDITDPDYRQELVNYINHHIISDFHWLSPASRRKAS